MACAHPCDCCDGKMSHRLGQFEDFGFEFEPPSFDFELPSFDYVYDVPAYDVPEFADPTFDLPETVMDPYTDEFGATWNFDDAGNAVSVMDAAGGVTYFDTSVVPETPEVMAEVYPPYVDDSGTAWYFDESGSVIAAVDGAGVTTWFSGDVPTEQTSPDGSQTTAPVPQPVSGGMALPSLRDLTAFIQTAAGAYRTVTGGTTTGPAPRPSAMPAGTQTRRSPTTGVVEYRDPRTGVWSTRPPTVAAGGAAGAQWLPGVSNTTLLVGAGVVGLAFMLARRR